MLSLYSARATATDVSAMPSALTTSIEWRCDSKVEDQIKGFEVEVSRTRAHVQKPITLQRGCSVRQVTLSDLESAVEYRVTVITKFRDGMKAKSETKTFISPGTDYLVISLQRIILQLSEQNYRELFTHVWSQ